MDVWNAIKNRRSCRSFSPQPVSRELIEQILEAAVWAPSPLNAQPWQFIVITNSDRKTELIAEAQRCKEWAVAASGWKWLDKYSLAFLKDVPVFIAVIGDPQKSGVDMFQPQGPEAYQHACAAAIQNMLLAAQTLDLGALWFTLFDKDKVGQLLGIEAGKIPLALICLGHKAAEPPAAGRKNAALKTTFID